MVSSCNGKEVVIVARNESSGGGSDGSHDSVNWAIARASNDCWDTMVSDWLSEFVMARTQSPLTTANMISTSITNEIQYNDLPCRAGQGSGGREASGCPRESQVLSKPSWRRP